MKLLIELTMADITRLITQELQNKLGAVPLDPKNVKILVRSKQNYHEKEWERGEFQVSYEADIQ